MAHYALQSGLFDLLPNEIVHGVVDHLVGEAAPTSTFLLPPSANDEIAALSALCQTCRRFCILVRPRLWARFEPRRPPGASIAAAPARLRLVSHARLCDQLDLFGPADPDDDWHWDNPDPCPILVERRPVDVGAVFASVVGAGAARRVELSLSREMETAIPDWGSLHVVVLRSMPSAQWNPAALPPTHASFLTHLALVTMALSCADVAACFALPALTHFVVLAAFDTCGSARSHASIAPRKPLSSLWLDDRTSSSFFGVVSALPIGLTLGRGSCRETFAAATTVSTLRLAWGCTRHFTYSASSRFFDEVSEFLRRSAAIRTVLVDPDVPQSFQDAATALGKTVSVGDEFDSDGRCVDRLFDLRV